LAEDLTDCCAKILIEENVALVNRMHRHQKACKGGEEKHTTESF